MKFTLLILYVLLSVSIYAQSSYVYIKNPVSNTIEVFNSSGMGLPSGKPIMTMKQNMWGYLEVTNSTMKPDIDPYTKKPSYERVEMFRTDFKGILNTLTNLNNDFERKNIISYNNSIPDDFNLKEYLEKANQEQKKIIETRKIFYNSFNKYPNKLKDGWHYCESYDKFNIGEEEQVFITYYLAKVTNNKIDSLFFSNTNGASMFSKLSVLISDSIKNCKAHVKTEGSSTFSEYYFIDGIVDPNHIEKPNFAFVKINNISSYPLEIFGKRKKAFITDLTISQQYQNNNISPDDVLGGGITEGESQVYGILNPTKANVNILLMNKKQNKTWILNNLFLKNGQVYETNVEK